MVKWGLVITLKTLFYVYVIHSGQVGIVKHLHVRIALVSTVIAKLQLQMMLYLTAIVREAG